LLNLIAIFTTVFLAELGDKTQLATLLFAADSRQHPALVFVAAAAALCLSTAIAVLLGNNSKDHIETVDLLVKAGADTEIKDRQGTTAIGHARARGYRDMITILQAATGRKT
jgi:ankyrin repeat protein